MTKQIFALILVLITTSALALLPPKYLSVKDFKQCLATKNMGTWEAWCLPKTKPDDCPDDSWQELNGFTGHDRIQDC
jgi:hypothetical protein